MEYLDVNPHDASEQPSPIPRAIQRVGLAFFLLGLVVASAFALTDHWRRATFVLGAGMVWFAALRQTCNSATLGLLTVRSRRFDVRFALLIGLATMYLSVSVNSLGS